MNDADALIRNELALVLPLPRGVEPDWVDVVRRIGPRPRIASRSRLLLAAAAVAVFAAVATVSPLGAAIADGIGSFSAWLSGSPGTPATPAEQQSFEEANARSWAGFAPGTKLRRLMETNLSATQFTLYGFRSGDQLCLRLVAQGGASGATTHCAPEHELQTARTPAFVVAADEPLGGSYGAANADGYTASRFLVTFGIASDGVNAVTVNADDGNHDALVDGNAFLYIADHPAAGTRVRHVEALAADGSRVALPFESSPYGMFDLSKAPVGTVQGPSAVERQVSGGTIGWVTGLQPRGSEVSADMLDRITTMATQMSVIPHFGPGSRWPEKPLHVLMARIVQPDPNDSVRFAIEAVSTTDQMTPGDDGICWQTITGNAMGGTCTALQDLFKNQVFSGSFGGSGASQYELFSGIASDDVASMKLYLADKNVVDVALRDNAYIARAARAAFPARLVAFDKDGKVIGVQTFENDGMTTPAPDAARKSVHELARVTGVNGGVGTLRAGTPAGGWRCWSISFKGGQEQGGCTPWPPKDEGLKTVGVASSGGDHFFAGEVTPNVANAILTYADGSTDTVKAIDGFFLYAIPPGKLGADGGFIAVRSYDANGNQLDSRGFKVGG
jgi:hypothetical protein